MHSPPLIGLTLGDPAGIGPELVLRALVAAEWRGRVRLAVYGNMALLRRVAEATALPWPADLQVVAHGGPAAPRTGRPARRNARATLVETPLLFDFPFPEAATLQPGVVHASCGRIAAAWIEAAARDARAGRLDALVTAPVNKEALHAAGVPYPGHTEMLAALTGSRRTAMLFWSPELIVGLATIHLPLAAVPGALTAARLTEVIQLTAEACRRFGRGGRPLAVLALNPHAGENGMFGREEETIVTPAIAAARAAGLDVAGPLVPDTAFLAAGRARYAGYVALYHDQGLIPFKMLAFEEGVNVTLGLPIVRTSPDHGTAFDIAWQGVASPTSLFSAIRCAVHLAPDQNTRSL